MTDKLICPKCGQPMSKAGRVRIGHDIKQRWRCARIAGCGYIKNTELDSEKIIEK